MTPPRKTAGIIPPAIVSDPPRRKIRPFTTRAPILDLVPSTSIEYCRRIEREQLPIIRNELTPAPKKRRFETPHQASLEVKALAKSLGADLVGICRLREAWVYADCTYPGPFAISLAMQMNPDEIEKAPGPQAHIETLRVYHDLGRVVVHLAREIARMGYVAVPQHPYFRTHILQIPVAMEAGIGVPGRNGLLITEEFGPRVRLGAIVTNLELQPDRPMDKEEIARFCLSCDACRRACPVDAIPGEPALSNGILKFRINVEKCGPYFRTHLGCSICIKSCPLSSAGIKLSRAELQE